MCQRYINLLAFKPMPMCNSYVYRIVCASRSILNMLSLWEQISASISIQIQNSARAKDWRASFDVSILRSRSSAEGIPQWDNLALLLKQRHHSQTSYLHVFATFVCRIVFWIFNRFMLGMQHIHNCREHAKIHRAQGRWKVNWLKIDWKKEV